MSIQHFTPGVDWSEIGRLTEVSTMFFYIYIVLIYVNSSKKSSLPLIIKGKIFQKLLNIVHIKVPELKTSRHISSLFWYQICKNQIKNKRVLITRTKSGTFGKIAKSAIQLNTIVYEICTEEWLILQSLKLYMT